ncbi:DUF927 domain-containing protein [Solimonas marina]|uniref:DUF927 domain-containing protein n=1 Tax=Solimonas marina TaxID=2714601 RepID=A0A969WBI5_9GAMM|nr:DUF927 domain-containing protein [Solimonas marina]NKF23065.1 DUF927 domain-containing protein [Solimonas marina]
MPVAGARVTSMTTRPMTDRSLSLGEIVDQFIGAMCSAGVVLSDRSVVTADGALHRFHVEGDKRGSRNGWFVLYGDGLPAGEFGSWRDGGTSHTWHANIGRELSTTEREQLRKRMEAARAERAAALEAERAKAKAKAAKLWEQANPRVSAKHQYLMDKGVRAFGIRQLREQLLIPLRDTAGELHGCQFIQPNGSKMFGTGTAKAGHYHGIGKPTADGVLGIVEGYATGATVHALTGWPVAVAFDAGNLRPVAEALRAKFPAARLVILADNDHGSSVNAGLTKGREAAAAVDGLLLFPAFEPGESGTDWNDYAAACGAGAAREALLRGVEASAAADTSDVPQTAAAVPSAAPAGKGRSAAARVVQLDEHRAKPNANKRISRDDYPAGFTLDEVGVWFRGRQKQGDDLEPPFRVCPPLRVLAYLRDTDQENWGILLSFDDKDRIEHRWALPWRMLSGSGEEMRSELLRQGFFVPPSQRARNLLVTYLADAKPPQLARSVERTGWHGEGVHRVFVLPDRAIGDAVEPVYFQSESLRDRVYKQAGELADWRSDVADLCRGNSRLAFAVSTAFASMLLQITGEEPGGFHFRGGSSTGKTTALRVAASIFGGTDYLRRWRATDNALEAVASMHNDALLILDELAQVDPKVAGNAAYMLGNGEGKQRAHRTGTARPVLRWRLLFLSAGEISLAEHMRQDGKTAQAGQETRLAEIGADAGAGLGLFEDIHGYADAAAFSRAITAAAAQHHGAAAPAFIEGVIRQGDELAERLRAERAAFCKRELPPQADGQAWRVASRFALVAAAGELATRMGITGWESGEAERAAQTCFRAWIEQRGGARNLEPARMVAQVRQFLERHGESRFAPWTDDGDSQWITKDRAGFRKAFVQSGTLESADGFYVLRETFREEMCTGFDHRDVARALAAAGALERDEKSRKFTKRVRLPRLGLTWCYVILPSIWQTSETSEGADTPKSEAAQ